MLLDDPLDHFRRDRVIPGSFRVDHRYGTLLADAQAIRLRSVNTLIAGQQTQLSQAPFQILPGFESCFLRRALRLGLIAAQKYVAADAANLQALRNLNQAFVTHASRDPRL